MFLNPKHILSYLPVRSGSRVGDFGAGSGEYTRLLAPMVRGEGAVYTFDIVPELNERLYRERHANDLGNVYTFCADLNQPLPLKDELLDSAVVANTFYALTEREGFLDELNRTLSPLGKVLLVDWLASFRNMGPREDEVVGPTQAVQLFRAHGFQVGEMIPAGTHHYAFVATKQ